MLLDLSESANDLAAPGGPTVLDLEKRAALLLAGSLAGSGDGVAVHGFSSDTRAAVDYVRLLDFGESPLGPAAGRVEAARARHSTRLGAALRHAGELALRADAERHAIVVVTDGEPSDVDVHDPRYLVEDARRRAGLAPPWPAGALPGAGCARRAAAARHVRRGRLPARDQSGPAGRRWRAPTPASPPADPRNPRVDAAAAHVETDATEPDARPRRP